MQGPQFLAWSMTLIAVPTVYRLYAPLRCIGKDQHSFSVRGIHWVGGSPRTEVVIYLAWCFRNVYAVR